MNCKRTKIILSISFLISFSIYILILSSSLLRTFLTGLITFIPFFAVLGILKLEEYIAQKSTDGDELKLWNNIFLMPFIIFVQLCLSFAFGIFAETFSENIFKITPISYPLLKYKYNSEHISHFPEKIPSSAKLNTYASHFGSSAIYLEFKADKEYMGKEIGKHKYKKIYYPQTPSIEMDSGTLAAESDINLKDLTFYIIDFEGYSLHHWPYSYGIATSGNIIIFFYSSPDTI